MPLYLFILLFTSLFNTPSHGLGPLITAETQVSGGRILGMDNIDF